MCVCVYICICINNLQDSFSHKSQDSFSQLLPHWDWNQQDTHPSLAFFGTMVLVFAHLRQRTLLTHLRFWRTTAQTRCTNWQLLQLWQRGRVQKPFCCHLVILSGLPYIKNRNRKHSVSMQASLRANAGVPKWQKFLFQWKIRGWWWRNRWTPAAQLPDSCL